MSWTDENIENVEEIFRQFAGEKNNVFKSRTTNIFECEKSVKFSYSNLQKTGHVFIFCTIIKLESKILQYIATL